MLLGIDIGTTTFKAAVFEGGHVLGAAAVPLATRRAPGGLAEQDPEAWLAALSDALAALAAHLPRVGAVGVTSQVNTHVPVDAQGRALAPAILWGDTRAGADASALDARIDAEARLRWWGAPMGIDASHALARMAWLARTQPALWEATAALSLPKDLVVRALTGEGVSDPLSNIGLVGPDGAYVAGLLALLPGAAGRLPPLRAPTAVAGETRLAPGLRPVPVAVGTMDAFAGFLGAGLARDGDAVWLSGTSEVLAQAGGPGGPGLLTFPAFGPLRVHAGPTQAGGAAVAWLCGALGLTPEALEAAVAAAPGPAPLFLPHLGGERAPLWDSRARGAFLGLEAGMGAGALGRGVYEGVALSARLVLDGLDAAGGGRADVLLCAGGGFRSDLWAQIRADATGRGLRRARILDAGVVGAAALGAVAAGHAATLAEALAGLVAHDRTFEPDPAQRGRLDDLHALYRPAYEALRPISHALAARVPPGVPAAPG